MPSLNGPPPAPTNPVRPTRIIPAGHESVDGLPPPPPTAAVVVAAPKVRATPVTGWQMSCTLSTFTLLRTFSPVPTWPAGQSIVYGPPPPPPSGGPICNVAPPTEPTSNVSGLLGPKAVFAVTVSVVVAVPPVIA